MTPEDFSKLHILAKKYKIFFDGNLPQEKWPHTHGDLFRNIQLLGETKYSQYKERSNAHSVEEPWRKQTINRAAAITQKAQRCQSETRNEAGWRLTLEQDIFFRFTIEVACPHCQGRMWRSEIEAFVNADLKDRPSLENRRRKRAPCQCAASSRQQDKFEPGLNLLFSDRAEELIYHDTSVPLGLQRREHPDRVYGLRETRVFEDVLSAIPMSRNPVRTSPFRLEGDSLLYPFLILEAKSEKGPDNFGDIEKQTSLPIRTLLKLQEELYERCGYTEDAPTIWFLANKGEMWRVSAGFVQNCDGEASYHIVDLWDGRITSHNGALQLLLILDYIFDWARDVYRPGILRHLRSLSSFDANDREGITKDNEAFSMSCPATSVYEPWFNHDDLLTNKDFCRKSASKLEPLRQLDSQSGALRDANHVEYRFLSLTMTGDTPRTILGSLSHAQAGKFACRVLSSLGVQHGCVAIDEATLGKLENLWTGEARSSFVSDGKKTLYTNFTYKTWLTDDWVIRKDLICLAVSKEAARVLKENVTMTKPQQIMSIPADQRCILDLFLPFMCCSPDYNLRASILRLALSSSHYRAVVPWQKAVSGKTARKADWMLARSGRSGLSWWGLTTEKRRDSAHILVADVYWKHKVGRREPSETYLRNSVGFDSGTSDQGSTPDPFPLPGKQLFNSNQEYVIVVGGCPQRSLWTTPPPEVCLFVQSRKVLPDYFPSLHFFVGCALEEALEYNRDIVTTSRHGSSRPLNSIKWNVAWTSISARGQHQDTIRGWIDQLRKDHGIERFSEGKYLDFISKIS